MSELPLEPNDEHDDEEFIDVGPMITAAVDADDVDAAEELIRQSEFIVLQQVDFETGEVELDEEGNFSVVLAEVEDEVAAVVCFTNTEAISSFVAELGDSVPEGCELPPVILDGNILIDGLPEDVGLLMNPSTDDETYFPPGTFAFIEDETGESDPEPT